MSSNSDHVEVLAVENLQDRNAREYKRVTLRTMPTTEEWVNPATGQVHRLLTPGTNVRAIGYRIPYLYEDGDTGAIADYLWDAQPGMVIQGKIVKRNVMPYKIDDETRNTATVFVQGDSSSTSFGAATKLAFDKSGRTLIEDAVRVPTDGPLNNPTASAGLASMLSDNIEHEENF